MIASLLAFLAGGILAWVFNELELISWRRAAEAHWTERARVLFPARVSRQVNIWAIPGSLTLASRFLFPDSPWGWVLLAGLCGTLLGNYPMDRATIPWLTFPDWTHQVLGSWLLHFSSWFTYGLAAALMPAEPDWTIAAIAFCFLLLQFGLQFGLGIRLMRALWLLKPACARLQALVDETSAAMGVPVRATWEMIGAETNAFAFVTTRELGFTGKLVAICPDDEIKAICAHELGHLTESRWALAARLVGAFKFFPLIFFRPAYALWWEQGVAVLAIAMLVIWVCHVRLARAMETRADKYVHAHVAETAVYARALERLHQTGQIPAVQSRNSSATHADLYDRMVAAGQTPEYARPAAPARQSWTSVVMTVIGMILALCLFLPTL